MNPTELDPVEPVKLPQREELAPIVNECFDLIKPRFELDGKKFILIVIDRNEFIQAATQAVATYGIDCAASCARPLVLRIVKDYIKQEEIKTHAQET
jgi:hypothetical protein